MQPLSLRTTFRILATAAAVFVLATLTAVSLTVVRDTRSMVEDTDRLVREYEGLGERAAVVDTAIAQLTRIVTGDEDAPPELGRRWVARIEDRAVASASVLHGLPTEMRVDLAAAAALESELTGVLNEALANHSEGRVNAALGLLDRAATLRVNLQARLAAAQQGGLQLLLQRQRDSAALATRLRAAIVFWSVVAAVLILAAIIWLRQRFYRPLAEIELGMARVSRGDYSAPVRVYRRDEIGRLAELLNVATGSVRARHEVQTRQTRSLSERLGRLLNDSTNEIYVFHAENLGLVQINGTARRNLQIDENEPIHGKTPLDYVVNLDEDRFRRDLQTLVSFGVSHLYVDGRNRRKDGTEYPFEGSIQYSAAEDPPVFVAIVRDVTEERDREERLRQAQKLEAIGQLTGGVAHDFNNLLTVITGAIELLRESDLDDETASRLLEEASRAAGRGAALTHQLLAYSRKQPLRPEKVDANKLLSDMEDLLQRTLGETIEVELVGADGLWSCKVDPIQLQNVILNLAINARDAMPGGGRLTIETANTRLDEEYVEAHEDVEHGQYVMIALTDTGEGMTEDMKERAFEPFFTTKEVGKGSGLGLSMVYGFVKQSGGHIKIYSELGEGTTVRLYIPRLIDREKSHLSIRSGLSPEEAPRGNGETVLVVEDDPAVRKLSAYLLRQLGYNVLVAGDASEALEVLCSAQGRTIDLLFTDVVLPGGKSGHDLAREAQTWNPSLRVLYASGYIENAVCHAGRLDSGIDLLEKPYRRDQLAVRVREILDRDHGT